MLHVDYETIRGELNDFGESRKFDPVECFPAPRARNTGGNFFMAGIALATFKPLLAPATNVRPKRSNRSSWRNKRNAAVLSNPGERLSPGRTILPFGPLNAGDGRRGSVHTDCDICDAQPASRSHCLRHSGDSPRSSAGRVNLRHSAAGGAGDVKPVESRPVFLKTREARTGPRSYQGNQRHWSGAVSGIAPRFQGWNAGAGIAFIAGSSRTPSADVVRHGEWSGTTSGNRTSASRYPGNITSALIYGTI